MSQERDTAIKEPQNQPGRAASTRDATGYRNSSFGHSGSLLWSVLFIQLGTLKQRQDLALLLAISTGGIAAFVGLYLTGQQLRTTRELDEARARWTGDLTATATCKTNKARGFIDG
jgi:hypothetical protein